MLFRSGLDNLKLYYMDNIFSPPSSDLFDDCSTPQILKDASSSKITFLCDADDNRQNSNATIGHDSNNVQTGATILNVPKLPYACAATNCEIDWLKDISFECEQPFEP